MFSQHFWVSHIGAFVCSVSVSHFKNTCDALQWFWWFRISLLVHFLFHNRMDQMGHSNARFYSAAGEQWGLLSLFEDLNSPSCSFTSEWITWGLSGAQVLCRSWPTLATFSNASMDIKFDCSWTFVSRIWRIMITLFACDCMNRWCAVGNRVLCRAWK